MNKQNYNNNDEILENLNIKNSNTLKTTEVGSHSLLTNTTLTSDLDKTGTIFATQNNVQVSDISRTKDSTDLMEVDWTYKNTTSKPFLQNHTIWKTTDTIGTHLIEYEYPKDYFLSNHVLNNIGQTFISMRGDIHFIVTVQGSPLLSGALIIHPLYSPNPQTIPLHPQNEINSWFFRQHAILDASDNSSTVDIIVPFRYYRNGIDPFESICKIYVTVLSPLVGLSNVSFTVTAYLENQEFKFIRPLTEPNRRTQGLIDVTTINNTLNDVVNATLPTNMTGDELNIKGMDDVGINTNPSSLLIKFNSLNNANNPHSIEKTALSPKTLSVSTKDTFNTTIDEMSINHIMTQRDHFLLYDTIKTNVAPSDPIFTMPLLPTIPLFKREDIVNTMSYIADTFKFWRGGLRFKIKFFMNRFQSMKFYLGLFYKAVAPTAFSDFSSSHGVVFDIGGDTREVEVEIPYNSETPWLHILRQPIDITATYPLDTKQWYDYMLGSLTLYALSPLISTDATEIKYVVTMSGAPDFEVANYCTTTALSQGVLQMSRPSKRTPNDITDIVSNMKEYYSKWQEIVSNDYLEITKQVSLIAFQPATILTEGGPGITGLSSTGQLEVFNVVPRTILDKTGMYAGYRGGIKLRVSVKIIPLVEITDPLQMLLFRAYISGLVPVCSFYNSDAFSTTPTNISDYIDDLQRIEFNNKDSIITPYLLTPINNTTQDYNTPFIYEVEIPYQRNTKYFDINKTAALDYGTLFFGFSSKYTIGDIKMGFTYNVLAKIADDGRYGILNYGGFTRDPIAQFSLVRTI